MFFEPSVKSELCGTLNKDEQYGVLSKEKAEGYIWYQKEADGKRAYIANVNVYYHNSENYGYKLGGSGSWPFKNLLNSFI